MRNYYQFFTFLTIVVLLLIGFVFWNIGSPWKQQLRKKDDAILQDFSQISQQIKTYFSTNQTLPQSLDGVATYNDIVMKLTNHTYEYVRLENLNYQLCATFNTDTSKLSKNIDYRFEDSIDTRHPAGHACINLSMPRYLLNQGTNQQQYQGPKVPPPNR